MTGGVSLNVAAEKITDSGFDMIITVKDTGIGIKEEELDKLFEDFSRADEKRNAGIEGTGLGLAITKRLINKMQGDISVSSEYGKGSTFVVTIPQGLVDRAPVNLEAETEDTAISPHGTIDATGKKILAVDDTQVNLMVIKGLLKPTNADVVLCKSGRDCLEIIKKVHFDIILLDHMMPEMNGIETLERAKSLEDSLCKDSIFIALTANAVSGVREKYLKKGFDDYLSKPIDVEALEAMLEKYII